MSTSSMTLVRRRGSTRTSSRYPWSATSASIALTTFASTISIDRYYDPATNLFISIDPDVWSTDQPYAFVNDDPLNDEDPLGLLSTSKHLNVGNSEVTISIDVSGQLMVPRTSIGVGIDGVSFKLHGVTESIGVDGFAIAGANLGLTLGQNGATVTASKDYTVDFKSSELIATVSTSVSVTRLPNDGNLSKIGKLGVVGAAVVVGAKAAACYFAPEACPGLLTTG